ncbi:hypothetical protein [Neisseria perflava]|uniref:hypothetical protein n=1 Tax=Neisseria perflava TaxID=33053 RepID=UPI00209E813B|nr:hypothetical protein [Neisseria perflava]MCP1659962.1 hypothetical protein [Neisseria perflava]MCP1773196.1 hypothetical protein [Neisseria perflava]
MPNRKPSNLLPTSPSPIPIWAILPKALNFSSPSYSEYPPLAGETPVHPISRQPVIPTVSNMETSLPAARSVEAAEMTAPKSYRPMKIVGGLLTLIGVPLALAGGGGGGGNAAQR